MKLRIILTLGALLIIGLVYMIQADNTSSTPSDSGGVVVQQ